MKNYVGIDLGTTNSAICSYDGEVTRIWKSPEQNDVTPSVIYVDRRGNKYIGKRAYDSSPNSPDNAAMLFKRLMGTSTPIKLAAAEISMTPEDCSAEILRVLFGYLPEEVRNDPQVGTVITVPAAFNQMQKAATELAAEHAGIGQVALMQEPVAAVMSVMNARKADGMFIVFDLGGGTLDIALAESIGGTINLLAHGGIAMCGGRDFDRNVVDDIVKPWLIEKFDLPSDFSANPNYKSLIRLAAWASERAKIELSAREDVSISLSEMDTRIRDKSGNEIYVDIPLNRNTFDALIEKRINDAIGAVRGTLEKAGLTSNDVDRIVFVGGPTNYKPLRDKVSFELGLPASGEVNPMTAVAEGAALFAESIDWKTENRGRKSSHGRLTATKEHDISFSFTARTPDTKAKIFIQGGENIEESFEIQIDSLDTGWTSGRIQLKSRNSVDVSLAKSGENSFRVFLFDAAGTPLGLANEKIVITRTAATVEAIPASHSIGIEVLEKIGGSSTIEWLIQDGDQLPKKGSRIFKAGESLKARSTGSLVFKLFEGESQNPADNRFIGMLKINGNDFDDGVIPAGGDLQCDYEMLDSGSIVLTVSVPSIGGTFQSGRNFYSPQEGQIDYTSESARVVEEGEDTLERLDEISESVQDPKLDQARQKLSVVSEIDLDESDTERTQEAMECILEARKLLAQVRREHLKVIRQLELDRELILFEQHNRNIARPSEVISFDNLSKTAQRAIDSNDSDFESHINELRGIRFDILWRQDWFVVEQFNILRSSSHNFLDQERMQDLVGIGLETLQNDDIDRLREVVGQLVQIRISTASESDMLDITNIIRG